LTKRWLPLIFGFALAGTPAVVESSHGTLYFIAASSTAIVVAADSLVSAGADSHVTAKRMLGTTDKLIPLGDRGVCFVGGYSSIAGKVYLEETARDWIRTNPKASLPVAHESIDAKLSASLKAFRSKHSEWDPKVPRPDAPFSYFICVGYYRSLPHIYATTYTALPHDITSAPYDSSMDAGRFATEGWNSVCNEILGGKARTPLSQFKSDSVVMNYRKALAANNVSSTSTHDLLHLSRICLEATESAEGREFDPNAQKVGSPNRYVVIEEGKSLKWYDHPN
jgi:hypothetical protein